MPELPSDAAAKSRLESIVKDAESALVAIVGFAESAKAAATAANEAQTPMPSLLSDAQARLAELVSAMAQVTASRAQITEESSAILTSAKSAATTVAEAQGTITAHLTEAQAKLSDVMAAATQAAAVKAQITDEQAVIATKSDHIQKAQEHADTVRANLDRALTAATQQATEAEGLKSRTQSAADTASTLLTEIRTSRGATEVDATAVAELKKVAEEATTQAKNLAEKASLVETKLAAYEKQLAELNAQSVDRLEKIEQLLRGATSAGLAHAFDERRKTFLKPQIMWQWVFIGSLIVVVGLAFNGLWNVYHMGRVPEWDELVRMWLSRLPVVGALVWLAVHSSRESALAKRLEEDYGFKSAIATCFEGFRKEMAAIGEDVAPNSALGKLCANTLTTIASPPGRIYDGHELTVTPMDEIKQLARSMTEAAKATGEATKPIVEAIKASKGL